MTGNDKIRIHEKASNKIPALYVLSIFTAIAIYQAGIGRMLGLPTANFGADWEGKMTLIALFFAVLFSIAIYQFKNPKALLILDKDGFDFRVNPQVRVAWSDVLRVEAQDFNGEYSVVPFLKNDAAIFDDKRFRRSRKAAMNRRLFNNSILIPQKMLAKPVDEVVRIMIETGNTGGHFTDTK